MAAGHRATGTQKGAAGGERAEPTELPSKLDLGSVCREKEREKGYGSKLWGLNHRKMALPSMGGEKGGHEQVRAGVLAVSSVFTPRLRRLSDHRHRNV